MEKSNPAINREMTWTTGPTEPGGPLPERPEPPPTRETALATFLPVARMILAALRPFPDAYRAVLAALNPFPPLGDPEPIALSP